MDYELDPPGPSERQAEADAKRANAEIAKLQKKLTLAKEGLLEIARVWDGYAPSDVARRTLESL